jgi:hypothetical protein
VKDDRISRYLVDRAADIELRPASVDTVVRRAAGRRRTRRGLVAAAVALTVGASSVLIAQRDDSGDEPGVEMPPAGVVPSPLDWAVVESSAGIRPLRGGGPVLGGGTTALTDDGAVYALSTAPGPQTADTWDQPATLYRSVDGTHWDPLALPGGFSAHSLTGDGGQLYAVGTSPAGGGVSYQLATSGDGGVTWTTAEVPSDVAELQARYPGEVLTGPPKVAVHDGTVVVTMFVYGVPDLDERVPGGVSQEVSWGPSVEGVMVDDDRDGHVERTYSWAEIGVNDELRDLVLNRRTMVAAAHDGGELSPIDVADDARGAQVVATDDGFTLFLTPPGTGAAGTPAEVTQVLRSRDGVSWEPAGELSGSVENAGTVGGRPAVAVFDPGTPTGEQIRVAQADGSWLSLDPGTVVGPLGARVVSVAFGPLGWAAVVEPFPPDDDDAPLPLQVVHSVDGTSMSVVPIDDLIDPAPQRSVETYVTADAVFARVSEPEDDDPATGATQLVVVGTPPG